MRRGLVMTMLALAGTAPAASQQAPAPAVPAHPAARVQGHRIVHPGEGITVRVPARATYVGGERFSLYGVADAEIHVFAEADAQRRISRLYWVQFESYLPSVPHRYNYAEGNTRSELWGAAAWLRWGPQRTNVAPREGSDREHVLGLLARAGYTVPPEAMTVRLVRMLDDPQGTGRGRRELMLIYSEDLAPTGQRYDALFRDGQLTAA